MSKRKNGKNKKAAVIAEAIILVLLLAVLGFVIWKFANAKSVGSDMTLAEKADKETVAEEEEEAVPEELVTDFKPHALPSTKPDNLINSTKIMVNDEVVESYKSNYEPSFGTGAEYASLDGVFGFRGNNYRNAGAFGTADIKNAKLSENWTHTTGSLNDVDGNCWTGNGWTGQPIIVTWPKETRKIMSSMEPWAQKADELTEVIYASLDGYIYFYELESGEATREPMYVGFTFKGAGALDPRGYPIFYVGAGVSGPNGSGRAFVINLVDCSVMYEFGHNENFASRGWNMFDSSPLVCAETDQLIYPGENGLLYIIHLNTKFNEKTGELSVDPDEVVKWKYGTQKNSSTGNYWLGIESSAAAIDHYVFLADNGGNLMCLDLNTLELVWVQDVLDDTNCSPVIDVEDGHPYIYISTSFHYGWRSYSKVEIPVWKIDAETGGIEWKTDFECYTVEDLSGGVQGTIAVGKNNLDNLIFVPVARTPTASAGQLVALNKETGEIVWTLDTQVYSWSSPTLVYDKDGKGYVVFCNTGFNMYLLDGLTGEECDSVNLGGNVEASPAIFNNYVVVGHRGQHMYCMEIT